jgi:hypothetical protein
MDGEREGATMAIAMMMRWDGVTSAQYDAVRKLVDWEGTPAAGGLLHVAGFDDGGLHLTDLWERPEDFQSFVDDRLMPGIKQHASSRHGVRMWVASAPDGALTA